MSDAKERIATAERARAAWDEFVEPTLADIKATYAARIVEIASTELSRDKRTDKITALSAAIRIADQIESGLQAVIMDGDIAEKDKLRADKMERMTAPQRRLLNMFPG